jgi:hypothetical protein
MFEWVVATLLCGILVVLVFIYDRLRHFVFKALPETSKAHLAPVFWEYDHPTDIKEHTTSKNVKALQEWEEYSEKVTTQINHSKAKMETEGKH